VIKYEYRKVTGEKNRLRREEIEKSKLSNGRRKYY
jgi:hypothetical protein